MSSIIDALNAEFTRKCSYCKEQKPLEEFNFKDKSNNIRGTVCRPCNVEYQRKWYKENAIEHRKATAKRRKEQENENQDKIIQYLSEHFCVDCGYSNIIALQFDHVTGTKKNDICKLVTGGYPWAIIEAEIAKCVVRCSNCHAIKTAKERNNYRYQWLELMKN